MSSQWDFGTSHETELCVLSKSFGSDKVYVTMLLPRPGAGSRSLFDRSGSSPRLYVLISDGEVHPDAGLTHDISVILNLVRD